MLGVAREEVGKLVKYGIDGATNMLSTSAHGLRSPRRANDITLWLAFLG